MTTPTARVNRSSYQALTSGVGLYLIADTKVWDNNVFWNAANPGRLTIRAPGLYLIGFNASYAGNATFRSKRFYIKLNGSSNIYQAQEFQGSNNAVHFMPSGIWYFHANDYIELWTHPGTVAGTIQLAAFYALAITPEALIP